MLVFFWMGMVTYIFFSAYNIILLNKKKKGKILPEGKIRYMWKSAQNGYSVIVQIMTAKTTTLRTLYVQAVLNSVMFPQFFMILFYMVFPKTATAKCNLDRWIRRVISTSTGTKANGVRLAHHWPTIFIGFFSKQCLAENIQGKFQKYSSQLLFLRNRLNSASEPAIFDNRPCDSD